MSLWAEDAHRLACPVGPVRGHELAHRAVVRRLLPHLHGPKTLDHVRRIHYEIAILRLRSLKLLDDFLALRVRQPEPLVTSILDVGPRGEHDTANHPIGLPVGEDVLDLLVVQGIQGGMNEHGILIPVIGAELRQVRDDAFEELLAAANGVVCLGILAVHADDQRGVGECLKRRCTTCYQHVPDVRYLLCHRPQDVRPHHRLTADERCVQHALPPKLLEEGDDILERHVLDSVKRLPIALAADRAPIGNIETEADRPIPRCPDESPGTKQEEDNVLKKHIQLPPPWLWISFLLAVLYHLIFEATNR